MYEVIGIEKVDYKNNAGNRVMGTRLYLVYDSEKIEGRGCQIEWCGQDCEFPPALMVGDKVGIYYNRYKRPECVYIKE